MVEYTLREEEPDWVNKAYTYEDEDHIHAVTSLVVTDENDNQTTNTYRYGVNGNMTCRIEGGETFLQAYNAENRMSGVLLVTGDCDTLGDTIKAWQFTYDGDGTKVKQEYTDSNGTLTTYYYAGGSYEVQTNGTTETVRQYYTLAGVSAGMRESSTFYYFLTDHLGSVVGVTDSSGTMVSETRYLPFGEIRTDVGTVSQTDYGYTFQKNDSGMGLMDYKARYFSTLLGRFTQPDTIIPGAGNPQAFNRYAYTTNNPINFTDPSGHAQVCVDGDVGGGCGSESTAATYIGAINAWFDNVTVGFQGKWISQQSKTLLHGLLAAASLHGGTDEFSKDVGNFSITPTTNPKMPGMVIPIKSPIMILNRDTFSVGTVLHETGHVFDFNGTKNKSDSFVSFFSPGVSCKSALLGCLNQFPPNNDNSNRLYAIVNTLVSVDPNYGYNPNSYGTTKYGAASTIDDWADTYEVMGLDLVGIERDEEQMNLWLQREMLVQMFLNR